MSTLAAGLLLVAPTAQADLIDLNTCNSNALSQPFLAWNDASTYELAPGGAFGDSSWTLSGRASLVPGGEPWAVTGTPSSSSVSLPAGSSATSPLTCVTAAYPTARFFVGGSGIVSVSMVYDGLPIPAGLALAGGGWAPSPVAVTLSAVTGALNGGTAQVSLKLTGVLGSPKVSDVFIDPRGRY
ncbi:MAG TPA: hypothetical protein VGH93_04200 [Solirubrobacteraceae bacterium]